MTEPSSTAIPEAAKATSTVQPPVQDINVAAEKEGDRAEIMGDRMVRAVGGGSPETPPDRYAGALGQLSGRSQAGMLRQLQRSYGNSYVGAVIQRKADGNGICAECEKKEKEIQRKGEGEVSAVPDGFEAAMQQSGAGQPLDEGTRSFMESRFNKDFGNVRVHTDDAAADAAKQIQAQAFTTGRDIYFGRGRFQPQTNEGQKLLAHELTHTVQQNGLSSVQTRLEIASPNDALEQAAQAKAEAISSGNYFFGLGNKDIGITQLIQRQPDDRASNRKVLIQQFLDSISLGRYEEAAVSLNGFNNTDINYLVGNLLPNQREKLRNAAIHTMPGWSGRVTSAIEELQHQENEKERVKKLGQDFRDAINQRNWEQAAILLNAYNDQDIENKLSELGTNEVTALQQAALKKMPGWSDRITSATAITLINQLPLFFPATKGGSPPLMINWQGGNVQGLAAEDLVLATTYPGATKAPKNYPSVDFFLGGQRTPITGINKSKKIPFSLESAEIDGGTLIQLKTVRNLSGTSYQKPGTLYNELAGANSGLEKLMNFKNTTYSETINGQSFRIVHSGNADKKILHIELEGTPLPHQESELALLRETAAGENIEVVVNWPGKGAKPGLGSPNVVGTVGLALTLAQMYARQKRAERQLETEGYAPVGEAAYSNDPWLIRFGAALFGAGLERATGQTGAFDIKKWRHQLRAKTEGKQPGNTFTILYQYPGQLGGLGWTYDIPVTYEKLPTGVWQVKAVEDPQPGFITPDLNILLDEKASDAIVTFELAGGT